MEITQHNMEQQLSIKTEFKQHIDIIIDGFDTVDDAALQDAADEITRAILNQNDIYTIGNGASAAIAQHWACDYFKGCSKNGINPRVISLSANIPLMTAIGNDISFDDVYSFQIQRLGRPGDILIVISSSGNSPNVVKAIKTAKALGVSTIALTGFNGGECKKLADISVHVNVQEYEATEDIHQALMHTMAKYIRNFLFYFFLERDTIDK